MSDPVEMIGSHPASAAVVRTFVLGGVYGPLSPHLDNSFVAILSALDGMMVTPPGGTSIIDVRDVAQLLAAALEPGKGARRFVAGGHFLTWAEWVTALSVASEAEIAAMDVTTDDMIALGIECDALRAAGEEALPLSEEAAIIMCSVVPTDDSATIRSLGITYRPVHDTLVDTVNYLRTTDQLSAPA